MTITAQDIDNQRFSLDRKGYSIEEVDIFLEKFSKEVDLLNKRIADLDKAKTEAEQNSSNVSNEELANLKNQIIAKDREIEELKAKVADNTNESKAISEALIVAQRSAEKIVTEANEQKTKIIKDANDKADYIKKEVDDQKRAVAKEIEDLTKKREVAKKEFKDNIEEVIETLNKHKEDLGYGRSGSHTKAEKTGKIKSTPAKPVAAAPVKSPAPAPVNAQKAAPAPQKDFSGFGDADFGDDKID